MRISDSRLGRFLSVDPLTKKYAGLTPYQFASNRPIDGIDQDGKEWSSTGKYFSSPEGVFRIDYTLKASLAGSVNTMVMTYDKIFLNNVGKRAEQILGNDRSKAIGSENDPIIRVNINFTDDVGSFKVNFKAFQTTNVYDPVTKTSRNTGDVYRAAGMARIGETQENEILIATSTQISLITKGIPGSIALRPEIRTEDEIGRTFAHELGHTLGLRHPFDLLNPVDAVKNWLGPLVNPKVKNNLMNSYGNTIPGQQTSTGTNLEPEQRKVIEQTVSSQQKKETKPN